MSEPPVYSKQWWEAIAVTTLTAIRAKWSVKKLQHMSLYSSDTPVSGDVLAGIKNERS